MTFAHITLSRMGRICARCLALSIFATGSANAALPIGSVVVYSDGRVEKLIGSGDGQSLWEDDRKRRMLRSDNPAVPVLERKYFLSGRGYRQRVVDGDPGDLFSKPTGTPVAFSVQREKSDGSSSIRRWECTRTDSEPARVLGKKRRLARFSCERFKIHRKFWNRSFRERIDFSFSDELGLVVESKRETRSRRSKSKLVAVLRPDQASYKSIRRILRKVRIPKGQK